MTYTVATMEVSSEAFDEISAKLRAAGYDHCFDEAGLVDMTHIGLVRGAREAKPIELTNERIDNIADLVVKGMPEGIQGFLKSWGWRQFARAVLEDCRGHVAVSPALAEMEARKDAAYLERNQVVAALAKAYPSGTARTAIEGWSEDWHQCVYIDLPTGQSSWHYHDSQAYLFADLPPYTGKWDGHTTEEKYARLAALLVAPPPPAEVMAALDRMCSPLHESRLSGFTAAEDARCMEVIRRHVLGAPRPDDLPAPGVNQKHVRVADDKEPAVVLDPDSDDAQGLAAPTGWWNGFNRAMDLADARMPAAEAVVLLLQCATLFRHYEALHLAKGTADGNEKAARNKAIADRVMQFLDRTQQDGGGV